VAYFSVGSNPDVAWMCHMFKIAKSKQFVIPSSGYMYISLAEV
jgi:hypothetical protein